MAVVIRGAVTWAASLRSSHSIHGEFCGCLPVLKSNRSSPGSLINEASDLFQSVSQFEFSSYFKCEFNCQGQMHSLQVHTGLLSVVITINIIWNIICCWFRSINERTTKSAISDQFAKEELWQTPDNFCILRYQWPCLGGINCAWLSQHKCTEQRQR